MATRPSPRSRDGTRPRSTGGRPPSSPRSSDSPRQSARSSVSASSAPDKPMPSFLRPTVSSSLHSSSSPPSSKGPAAAPKRSADKSPAPPVVAPRPITPKDKAKAAAATSRWSAVSPRQLMQRASNAIKGSKPSRANKGKDVAGPATSASGKERTSASAEAKTETTRNPAEPPPAVQSDEVAVEPEAEQNEQPEATSQEVVSTDTTTFGESTEEPSEDAEKNEAVEEKVILVESQEAPEQEEKPQTGVDAETVAEAQKNAEDELPPPAVVEEAAKEAATSNRQDQKVTSTVEQTVAVEEEPQEDAPKPEQIMENSETSMISEEPEVQHDATEKQEEVAGEANMAAGSSAPSEPATPLKEALDDADPVTPAKEAINKDKAVIETLPGASEPTTPVKGAAKKEGESTATTSAGEAGLTFKGSKVKTAMEKRSDEEQPKKKEVARSNDVIEEAKSKLLEKRKSKVKALVGAFETVMDTPTPSPGKST